MLTNGNYVVTDALWADGSTKNVGTVYLYHGNIRALISTLTGSTANDQIGGGVTTLKNENYVISSRTWANGAAVNAGAVTWCSGNAGAGP